MAGRIGLGKRFRHEIRIGEQLGQPVRDPCELAFERIGGFQDGRARLAELSQRPCHCALPGVAGRDSEIYARISQGYSRSTRKGYRMRRSRLIASITFLATTLLPAASSAQE